MATEQSTIMKQNSVTPARNAKIQSIVGARTVKADFRVCCNHQENLNPCKATVNAVLKNFNNVVKIQTAKPYEDTDDMCVIGTAIIKPSMRAQFEKDLKRKINKNERSIKVIKAIVALHQ